MENKKNILSVKLHNKALISVCFLLLFIVFPSLAISKDLDQAIVHYNQGYDYYKKGEYDKAIEEPYQILHIDNCFCSICNEWNTYLYK